MAMPEQDHISGGTREPKRHVDGLLLLDKPRGLTSNAALQRVKRLFRARKAGHTGSLDPLADGMLPLCFGQATKVSGYLLNADKSYRVSAIWGTKTDTGDADGAVIETVSKNSLDRDTLEEALTQFRGAIEQIPPMYSALKRDGRRLYQLAREGKEVPRDPRTVNIFELEVDNYDPCSPELRVRCSKGTYIRTLIEDIAEAVGSVGHVSKLRRVAVYPFQECQMVSLESLEAAAEIGMPDGERCAEVGLVRLYDQNECFMGIGETLPDGRVAPRRLFVTVGPDS
jgi:tRNA pseudouridine55 synthase